MTDLTQVRKARRQQQDLINRMSSMQAQLDQLNEKIEAFDPEPQVERRIVTMWMNNNTGYVHCRISKPDDYRKGETSLGCSIVTITEGEFVTFKGENADANP